MCLSLSLTHDQNLFVFKLLSINPPPMISLARVFLLITRTASFLYSLLGGMVPSATVVATVIVHHRIASTAASTSVVVVVLER